MRALCGGLEQEQKKNRKKSRPGTRRLNTNYGRLYTRPVCTVSRPYSPAAYLRAYCFRTVSGIRRGAGRRHAHKSNRKTTKNGRGDRGEPGPGCRPPTTAVHDRRGQLTVVSLSEVVCLRVASRPRRALTRDPPSDTTSRIPRFKSSLRLIEWTCIRYTTRQTNALLFIRVFFSFKNLFFTFYYFLRNSFVCVFCAHFYKRFPRPLHKSHTLVKTPIRNTTNFNYNKKTSRYFLKFHMIPYFHIF